VSDGLEEIEPAAQQIQRDLTYCRKIVIDADRITSAADPIRATEEALSFLFPFDLVTARHDENVRERLIGLIAEAGVDRGLVTSLVNAFDTEADCRCWDRVLATVADVAEGAP
jgi:hypothetical protein